MLVTWVVQALVGKELGILKSSITLLVFRLNSCCTRIGVYMTNVLCHRPKGRISLRFLCFHIVHQLSGVGVAQVCDRSLPLDLFFDHFLLKLSCSPTQASNLFLVQGILNVLLLHNSLEKFLLRVRLLQLL